MAHANPPALELLGEAWAAPAVGLRLSDLFPGLPRGPHPFGETGTGIAWPRRRTGVAAALELNARRADEWLPGGTVVALAATDREPAPSGTAGEARLARALEDLAAVRHHLSTLARGLHSPVAAALGLTEVLDETPVSSDQRDLLVTLEASIRRMSHLVDGSMELIRLRVGGGPPSLGEYSVVDAVEAVAAALGGAAARRGVEVSMALDPALPWLVRGDARRVRYILGTLGTEAIASATGGGVHLEVSPGPALENGGREIVFEVRGSAQGSETPIPAPEVDPPGRLHPSPARDAEGELEVVRLIVEELGGTSEMRRVPGGEWRFTVRLPHGEVDRPCPARRRADRTWPDTAVLVAGGSPLLHRGIAAGAAHMGSRVEVVSPDRLVDRVRDATAAHLVVLLDHTLGQDLVGRLAAVLPAAASPRVSVRVAVLSAPGDEALETVAGRDLPTLAKPVARRHLAVLLADEDPVVAAEGPLRILVVDDDRAIRLGYRRLLPRMLDAEVVECTTAAEALTGGSGPAPRIALVGLPHPHAAEMARALRRRHGREVVVVARGGGDEPRTKALLDDGTLDALLPEASTPGEIARRLEELLARSPTRHAAMALSVD